MAGFVLPDLEYQHPDLGDEPEVDPYREADLTLTRRIGEFVYNLYPGHPFLIEVTHAGGVVMISLPPFTGMRYKWIVKIEDLKSDPSWARIMQTCGEILERYNLPRAGFDQAAFLTALEMPEIVARGEYGYVPV